MEEINSEEAISNERFYLEPHSFSTLLFEKELRKCNIKYYKDDLAVLQPYIVYSVLKKDLGIATEIFDKIQQEEYRQIDLVKQKKKEKKKAKRNTIGYRQKQVSIWILILIGIIVISMLVFLIY